MKLYHACSGLKYVALVLMLSFVTLPLIAGNIAYIYGDVAPDGAVPSGPNEEPYDQMLLADSGDTGLSLFKELVERDGHTITGYYDKEIRLNNAFLNQFDGIIFGLHQEIWTATEKRALHRWLSAGGNALIYSDSASGGFFKIVGGDNPIGQTVTNNLISDYGMEVTVDLGGGTASFRPGPNATDPLVVDRPILEGEGVSPVAVDTDIATILIPYNEEHRVEGLLVDLDDPEGITIENPQYAALAHADVGSGKFFAMFDRQPMWNNGPGSDIEEKDNEPILRGIVDILTGGTGEPQGLEVYVTGSLLVHERGTASLIANPIGVAATVQWSQVSGPGTVQFGEPNTKITRAIFSEPGIYNLQVVVTNSLFSASTPYTVEVVSYNDFVLAINAGGPSYKNANSDDADGDGFGDGIGFNYEADNKRFYKGGSVKKISNKMEIEDTYDDPLYRTARVGHSYYQLEVANGRYSLLVQLAEIEKSKINKRIFDLSIEGNLVLNDLDLYAAVGDKLAVEILYDVVVEDGSLDLGFMSSKGGALINGIVVANAAKVSTPSIGIPGRIEAEDYNEGGQNVGYFDKTTGNIGGLYREDDVDLDSNQEGGYCIGWVRKGEWVAYTINVAETGYYNVVARVASGNGANKSLAFEVDGELVGSSLTFNTNGDGWYDWKLKSGDPLFLEAGVQELRILLQNNKFNLDYVELSPAAPSISGFGINSGGPAIDDFFAADSGFSASNLNSTSQAIVIDSTNAPIPAPESLYQSERWNTGDFSYVFAGLNPNNDYTVRLHFAEIFFISPGQRIFGVDINGKEVLAGFDILAEVDAFTALVKEFKATADASGSILINFRQESAANAKISGIELIPVL
ncbi:MAG: malectin domain-containing carbohydrate-binding protein [Verrucomicrobiota bacterium]